MKIKNRLFVAGTSWLFVIIVFQSYAMVSAGDQNLLEFGRDDRCPVCAMKVAMYPKFACVMELNDGRKFSFCAAGCLIRSWLNPEVFLKAEKTDILYVWVKDYFSGQKIDGLSAFWVAGSDVIGPMGPAIVPLKTENDAEIFKRRHGGKDLFKLNDLTDEKWKAITGK